MSGPVITPPPPPPEGSPPPASTVEQAPVTHDQEHPAHVHVDLNAGLSGVVYIQGNERRLDIPAAADRTVEKSAESTEPDD